jgi:hypothetical protein
MEVLQTEKDRGRAAGFPYQPVSLKKKRNRLHKQASVANKHLIF